MRITTLNVNGLRAAHKRGFLAWLHRHSPDVLMLQEVRARLDDLPAELTQAPGWHKAWMPAAKPGYSGTAIWSREPGEPLAPLGQPRSIDEGRVIGRRFGELEVYSVYAPSGSAGEERQAWKMAFLEAFEPWLAGLLASGRPVVFGGDINIAHQVIDIRNAKANMKNSGFLPEERAWMDTLFACGWRDLFRERWPERVAYSWWSARGAARAKDVGWRIDYLIGSPALRLGDADIERDADLSDHAPVTVTLT